MDRISLPAQIVAVDAAYRSLREELRARELADETTAEDRYDLAVRVRELRAARETLRDVLSRQAYILAKMQQAQRLLSAVEAMAGQALPLGEGEAA